MPPSKSLSFLLWMIVSLFLIPLSIKLAKIFTGEGLSPCRLRFLSLQIVWIASWNMYLITKDFTLLPCGLIMILIILSHWFVYLCSNTPSIIYFQIWAEYSHSKNKCSIVSKGSLHKTQDLSTNPLQCLMRSPVAGLPFIATQVMKECFDVTCLNQISLYQFQAIYSFLITFHVSLVEKFILYCHVPFFHKETSSSLTKFAVYLAISSSTLFKLWTRWCCLLCFLLTSTVAFIGIPISI